MAASQEFLIVRGDDLLVLGVHWEFINLHLDPDVVAAGRAGEFVALPSGKIVLTFPPQSIAEEKLTGGPFTLRRARLAGPSRVEFFVEPFTTVELGAEGILKVLLAAAQFIVSSASGHDDFTAIELPWGLVVTAEPRSRNATFVSEHAPRPVVSHDGVTGLWNARLRASDGSATDARLALIPLQAKPDPEDTTLNLAPLSAADRQNIQSQSAAPTPELRRLAEVERLELSALGGSFSARGIWPNFEWDHDTTLGRDQRVRVLSKGVLYPFGHRAEFQILAERVMDPTGQASPSDPPAFAIAGMRKELALMITEPVRRAVNDERLAREFPFAEVEILTTSFRDIREPRPDTANPWDWITFQRTPIAPDAIQEAINATNAELGPLIESVTQVLKDLPDTFEEMLQQGFQSALDLQAARDELGTLDPEGMARHNAEINHVIDTLPPETPQEEISALIDQLFSNEEINAAFARKAQLEAQLPGLEAAVQQDLDNMPDTIKEFADQGDENAQRVIALQDQLTTLEEKLQNFIAAKATKHNVFFTPHTNDGKPLMFPVRCPNAEGDVFFSLPLIFVIDETLPRDDNFLEFRYLDDPLVVAHLEAAWQSRNAVPLPGVRLNPLQRAPIAPPKSADIQEVHQITIAGHSHNNTFRPSLTEFLVDLPTLRTLLPNQPERVALKLRDEFLNLGDQVDLALAPVRAIGIDFTDQPDRSGGLISPKYAADVISRELGPVAKAALPDINVPVPNLSSVYDGATLLGFPLAKLIRVDGPEGLPKPPKIVPVMENGIPSGARMEWTDIRLKNHGPLRVKNTTKFRLMVESSKARTETTCTLSDFALVMPPTGPELLELSFKSVVFTQQIGRAPDLQINGLGVDFRGALKLLKKLQEEILPLIGISGPKPSIEATKSGITAKYALHLPRVPAGAFLLKNIAILIAMEVPFTKKPVTVSLGFASRENPFALTVLMFGGGGYIDVQVGGEGITRLEASLEFGAMIDIDLVVARAEVHALGGVHFLKSPDGSINLEAYLRIGGSVEVLGLVSVSVELVVMLTYESEPNRLVGRATLVIEVDVTFFSEAVTLDTGEYVLAGSETARVPPAAPSVLVETEGDPGLAAWRQARRAFAEA